MSGLTDALGDVGNYFESVPKALGQAGKDVAEYPGQATVALQQLVRDMQEGYGQKVADPLAHWAGLNQPYAEDTQPSQGPDLPRGESEIGGKKYKFSKETLDPSKVEDVTSAAFKGQEDPAFEATLNANGKGFQNIDEGKLTDKEYDTLTREAAKGNKLAQGILVKGKYKEQGFPSLSQDMAKYEDPFVKALSGLPAEATSLQGQMNATMKPYDFTNADSQVNTILSQMGSSARMAPPTAATQNYANKIQDAVFGGENQLNAGVAGMPGIPSIEGALSALGPAGKLSEKATPNEALLAALLGHEQTQIVYGNAAPSAKSQPNWLQQLIEQVTGSTLGGGLVSPSIAANAVGTTPGALPNTSSPNA